MRYNLAVIVLLTGLWCGSGVLSPFDVTFCWAFDGAQPPEKAQPPRAGDLGFYGRFGWRHSREQFQEAFAAMSLPITSGHGVLVTEFYEIHADRIQAGDIIKSINGISLTSERTYQKACDSLEAGKECTLRIKRFDTTGKEWETITVVTRSVDAEQSGAAEKQKLLQFQAAQQADFLAKNTQWVSKCARCGSSGKEWFPKGEDPNTKDFRCRGSNPIKPSVPCEGVLFWSK